MTRDPRTRRSLVFDRIAEEYDATRGGLARGRRFAPLLCEHLPPGETVLEVGVGTGAIAAAVAERGHDVVGIDLGPAMLARAQVRLGTRIALADAHELPVRDGSVGGVLTVWVLHAVAEPARVVGEIARVLRLGGVWCVVPADPDAEPGDIADVEHDLRVALGRFTDAPERVRAWATAVGLVQAAATHFEPFVHMETPEQAAQEIERRTMSALWDLDAEAWARTVQPRIDALRALPDPQRPRRCARAHRLLVFRRS